MGAIVLCAERNADIGNGRTHIDVPFFYTLPTPPEGIAGFQPPCEFDVGRAKYFQLAERAAAQFYIGLVGVKSGGIQRANLAAGNGEGGGSIKHYGIHLAIGDGDGGCACDIHGGHMTVGNVDGGGACNLHDAGFAAGHGEGGAIVQGHGIVVGGPAFDFTAVYGEAAAVVQCQR